MNRQIPFLTLLIQGFLGLPNHNDKRFYKNLCLDSWATFTLFPYQKKIHLLIKWEFFTFPQGCPFKRDLKVNK